MYPIVTITESFLDHFNKMDEEISSHASSPHYENNENRLIRKSFDRMYDLLCIASLNISLSQNSINNFDNINGNKPDSYKEWIIFNAIKNSRIINLSIKEFKFVNSCYFTDIEFSKTLKLSEQRGVMIIGQPCCETPFFLEHSFSAIDANDTLLPGIALCSHICSGMIIIDKYLFKDTPNKSQKIVNLISVLERFVNKTLLLPFELDIIIENPESNTLLNTKYMQILNAFGSDKISLHLYAPRKLNGIGDDRYLVTNYSVITVGHPFDRGSYISCNFYPSHDNKEAIKTGYKTWRTKIEFTKKIIKDHPKKPYGYIENRIVSDDTNHSIFNL
ncbi:MAG: hypothetical protein Q8L07_14695 [Sediminibacterium sp.]|nr:hypothetical protein [Sediminibacterium sp.]